MAFQVRPTALVYHMFSDGQRSSRLRLRLRLVHLAQVWKIRYDVMCQEMRRFGLGFLDDSKELGSLVLRAICIEGWGVSGEEREGRKRRNVWGPQGVELYAAPAWLDCRYAVLDRPF